MQKLSTYKTPEVWQSVRHNLEQLAGSPVIMAGGCLRDYHFDAPIKDVDLFLEYSDMAAKRINRFFVEMGWLRIQDVDGSSCNEMSDVELVRAYRSESTLGWREFNIIFMADSVDLKSCIERIDFGVCQIGMGDGDEQPWVTDAFLKDSRDKTFTLTRSDPTGRSAARFDRLSEKYPRWTMVPYRCEASSDLFPNPGLAPLFPHVLI